MAAGADPVVCRLCGVAIRDEDSIVVIRDEPLHAPCAEVAFRDSDEWEHTSVTTLSQWARGIGWGSASH